MPKPKPMRLIALEGAHRVGKGTCCELLCKRTGYRDMLIDRAWASNWAFAKLYNRDMSRLDLVWTIHEYFANPSAYVVHFKLGIDDYEQDRESDAERKEQWVGPIAELEYSNRLLAEYVQEAIDIASGMSSYADRILQLTARAHEPDVQANLILSWLDQFTNE